MKTIFPFKQLVWFILLMNLLTFNLVLAGPHPNMYLNQEEIDAIKTKVDAGIEPWASGYIDTMFAANSALTQPTLSVTFQGRTSNQYYTESPYCGWTEVDGQPPDCRDGQINPAQDRGDYVAVIALGDAVRDLGLGYAFTGDEVYANKAIELIRVWSLDLETRMLADETAMKIELFITLPGYFYGADLIWNYEGGWVGSEKEDFRTWVKKIGDFTRNRQISAINSANGTATNLNNFANWRNVVIGSAGALLDDNGLLEYMELAYKHLMSVQVNGSGSAVPGYLGQEVTRTQGLHYSLFATNAMIQGAEIMRHRGVNLYDYVDSGTGAGLELVLGFVTPFAIDPESWELPPYNYPQIATITQDNSMALFELAYSYYQDPIYLEAINRWGRPMDEIRIMGNNTFTHGNMFELDFEPVTAGIITHPLSQNIDEGASVTFTVVASGSGTLNYQWFSDDEIISDATSSSYTLESVSGSDDGVSFHCVVTKDLESVVSNDAVLTVVLDTTAPVINAASVRSADTVDIIFSEAVSALTAESIANYQINTGIQVLGAVLAQDQRTVQLQIDNLETDTVYTLSVSGIQDTSFNSNEIEAGSSVDIVFAPVMNFDNGFLPFGWIPLTESRWSVVNESGDNALFLNTSAYDPLSGLRLGEHITSPESYSDFSLSAEVKSNESAANANADYALMFGFQDGDNYYYMLFNRTMSNAQLFLVDEGVRQEIATVTENLLIDDEYHDVEVRRLGGTIEVRFDNTVVLQIVDSTFLTGKLGLGSYNDSSYFDNIRITGAVNSVSDLIFRNTFE